MNGIVRALLMLATSGCVGLALLLGAGGNCSDHHQYLAAFEMRHAMAHVALIALGYLLSAPLEWALDAWRRLWP